MSLSREVVDRLFSYDDYRAFLRDWFEAKKKERASFSLRYFAQKAGFASHNFCSYLISSQRNCSAESARRISQAVGLRNRASEFFESLVMLNQAETAADKEYFYEKVKKASRKTKKQILTWDQFAFYEKWYYPVVRELMIIGNWKEDPALLAKIVNPAITAQEASEAVDFLLKTGMVVRNEEGRFMLSHDIVTSEEVPVYIKRKSRRDVLLLGADIIDSVPAKEKYVAYSTVSMGTDCFTDVKKILDDAREAVLLRISEDEKPLNVYEVVFQMFPVSKSKPDIPKAAGESE